MKDRHTDTPISLRLPKDDQAWLEKHIAETGGTKRGVLKLAFAQYRESIEQSADSATAKSSSANAGDASPESTNADSASANPPTASS